MCVKEPADSPEEVKTASSPGVFINGAWLQNIDEFVKCCRDVGKARSHICSAILGFARPRSFGIGSGDVFCSGRKKQLP